MGSIPPVQAADICQLVCVLKAVFKLQREHEDGVRGLQSLGSCGEHLLGKAGKDPACTELIDRTDRHQPRTERHHCEKIKWVERRAETRNA